MIRALRRTTNIIFALLLAVFSVNLSGVLSLNNAAAASNNGTLKVQEKGLGVSNANNPKVCDFRFVADNLDHNQTGNITIEGQNPTPAGTYLVVPISTNNQGDGQSAYINDGGALTLANGKYKATLDNKFGTDSDDKAKSKVFWVDCPTSVTPTAPTQSDPCGIVNDKYTIPTTEGVTYKVWNGFAYVTKSAGSYTAIGTVKIKAYADDGYVLQGTSEWTFTYTNVSCGTPVIATAPTKDTDPCGTVNDKYVIPSKTGVDYYVNGVLTPAGTYNTNGAQVMTITAVAQAGYILQGTASWTLNFTNVPCPPTPITAAAPEKIDLCGTANDKYIIPESAHVKYYVNLSPIAKPAGEYTAGHIVGIIAVPDPGYVITSQFAWVFVYTDAACPVPVTPGEVTSVNPCGTDKDGFTIPATEGVIYKNGDEVLTPGFHPATGTVTIVAVAEPGYVIQGQVDDWTFTYTNEACPPKPCTPTMVTLRELTLNDVTTDDNCPPGMGGAGGETPTTPKPVIPAGIVLPETGADEGNALVKAFTLLIAGLTTYGIMFFVVNRRQLSKK